MPFDMALAEEKYGFIPMNHVEPQPFNIDVALVYDDEGREIPGYKRIERTDTGDTLAVHEDTYTVIPYGDTNTLLLDTISDSDLDMTDMMIHEDSSANGARYWREYVFPKHICPMPDGSDQVLRIVTQNSLDKSASFNVRAGAYRFVCANGALIGVEAANFRVKHTKNAEMRVQSGVEALVDIASTFDAAMTRQSKWVDVALAPADFAEAVAKALPQCSENLANQMLAAYITEPSNLWSAYNVLTSWASKPIRGDRKTVHDRQLRVARTVEHKAWRELEAA